MKHPGTRRSLDKYGLAFIILLAGPVAAHADDPATAGAPTTPARIANHYDHRAFQPTPAQVCTDPSDKGVNCSSKAGKAADRRLAHVQRQIDDIEAKYPPGYLKQDDAATAK